MDSRRPGVKMGRCESATHEFRNVLIPRCLMKHDLFGDMTYEKEDECWLAKRRLPHLARFGSRTETEEEGLQNLQQFLGELHSRLATKFPGPSEAVPANVSDDVSKKSPTSEKN